MIKENWKVWVFFCFFMLTVIISYSSGYITKKIEIQKQQGIELSCYRLTDDFKVKNNQCNATIEVQPSNVTLKITSTFNNIKVITS